MTAIWRVALAVSAVLVAWGPPAFAQAVVAVPLGQAAKPTDRWVPGRFNRKACVDTSRIAGAVVVDPRHFDVILRGGPRFRVMLAAQCPQLSYYGGFYYKPVTAGELCAGVDRIIGRAGGACQLRAIAPLRREGARKR